MSGSDKQIFRKIAVLAGGPSSEREISLISGKAVHEALLQSGMDAVLIDPQDDLSAVLARERVTFAFIALHGAYGEDGTVQGILESIGVAYSGCGPQASALAFDKARAQDALRRAGVRVPDFRILRPTDFPQPPSVYPCVVKPTKSGSSLGVKIVEKKEAFLGAVAEAFRHSDAVLVEDFIAGRELTVGVLGGEALPVVEVIAQRSFYDFEAKYRDTGTRYVCPAELDQTQCQRVTQAALAASRALGCDALCRVDVLLGRDDLPYVLEANTVPGLTGKSLLPKAAKARGIDFPALCVKIMELSIGKEKAAKIV